ncbi:DUF6402 family protein [Marinagarivorans cellulosilyticus]|uniref:Uncharacterized protein n=1 Tax=Marinagarivorans cellulosilyticus TaxID=2721545 RepID=A0AAN2BIQ6_9GAMM|nr:DUF6402 family protein [Marinagarivorans cellulosilyticus]BCD96240.1 hypothetical protein MARGE09_P0439 [Marinagarivorans cellulosilyticus]
MAIQNNSWSVMTFNPESGAHSPLGQTSEKQGANEKNVEHAKAPYRDTSDPTSFLHRDESAFVTAFNANSGVHAEITEKRGLDRLPTKLVQPEDRVVFNLEQYFLAEENATRLAKLWHYWLYGKKKAGDNARLVSSSSPREYPIYIVETEEFATDEVFQTRLDEAINEAAKNTESYPNLEKKEGKEGRKLTAIEKNMMLRLREAVFHKEKKYSKQIFRTPSEKDLYDYDPRTKPKRTAPCYGLPCDVVRIASPSWGTPANILQSWGVTELVCALGGFAITIFADIHFEKDEDKNTAKLSYSNLAFAVMDRFDFEDDDKCDTQSLGYWDETGLNRMKLLDDSHPNYVTNKKVREFKGRIKDPYNNDRGSESKLECRDFNVLLPPRPIKDYIESDQLPDREFPKLSELKAWLEQHSDAT